jgi:hypothetical protein
MATTVRAARKLDNKGAVWSVNTKNPTSVGFFLAGGSELKAFHRDRYGFATADAQGGDATFATATS